MSCAQQGVVRQAKPSPKRKAAQFWLYGRAFLEAARDRLWLSVFGGSRDIRIDRLLVWKCPRTVCCVIISNVGACSGIDA